MRRSRGVSFVVSEGRTIPSTLESSVKKRSLALVTSASLICAILSAIPSASAHADYNPVYRPVAGASSTHDEQLATLAYWLGPDYDSAAKLEQPFAAAAYTANADAKNGTKYASHVPNLREFVPDRGNSGKLYSGTGAVTRTVGKLFFVETGVRARVATDQTGDHNYLGELLTDDSAYDDAADPWVHTVGYHEVVDETTNTTTDSWTGVCSADSVVSANGSTVLTAGHCVEAPPVLARKGSPAYDRAQMSKWIFVPGFVGITGHGSTGTDTTLAQAAPSGVWVASRVYTTPYWDDWTAGQSGRNDNALDLNAMGYDVAAMTVVNPLSPDTTLAGVVGAQNVAFDTAMNQNITAFGYPQVPDSLYGQFFGGRSLATCTGSSFSDILGTGNTGPGNVPGLKDHGLWCTLNEGSSGGPMFYDYDAATGTGTQVSVISFPEPPEYIMGPQFGSVVQGVYDAIEDLAP